MKKRSKKLWHIATAILFNAATAVSPTMSKSFLVLFFKKEHFPLHLIALRACRQVIAEAAMHTLQEGPRGWVAEWFKAAVLKTAEGASPP